MADLASAGLSAEQLALVIELSASVAAEARPVVDRAAENKRAYDREYRRAHSPARKDRKSRTKSYDKCDTPDGSPKDINQTPSLPPAQVSEPDGSSPEPRPWSLPVGVSLQVWQDFKRNRERKRLPNTDTAWKAFNDDVKRVSAQTGIPPPKLIQMCTAKGWGAIYDPREERNRYERDSNPLATAVQRVVGAHH